MVETPVRRSRRIRAQSEDDASSASGGSRGSHSSRASDGMGTPTRRSARLTRNAVKGGAKGAANELEAIPEASVSDGDVRATAPVKSTKKKHEEGVHPTKEAGHISIRAKNENDKDVKVEADATVGDKTDIAKSVKVEADATVGGKTDIAKNVKVEADATVARKTDIAKNVKVEEDATVGGKTDIATPAKLAKKTKKDRTTTRSSNVSSHDKDQAGSHTSGKIDVDGSENKATKKEDEEVSTEDKTKRTQKGTGGVMGGVTVGGVGGSAAKKNSTRKKITERGAGDDDVAAVTPAKARNKKGESTEGESNREERGEVPLGTTKEEAATKSATESNPDGGGNALASPAKSSKKAKKKSPLRPNKVQSEQVKEKPVVEVDDKSIANDSIVTSTSAKSPKRKKKKNSPGKVKAEPKRHKEGSVVAAAVGGRSETNEYAVATPSTYKALVRNDVHAATPVKSAKESEEKPTPKSPSEKTKGVIITNSPPESSSKKSSKKKRKQMKKSLDSETASTLEASHKTSKVTAQSCGDDTPLASAPTQSSKKKKHRKGVTATENASPKAITSCIPSKESSPLKGKKTKNSMAKPGEAIADREHENEDQNLSHPMPSSKAPKKKELAQEMIATEEPATGQSSQPTCPASTKKKKDKKKKKKKIKRGAKTMTKELVVHKKQQSSKHGRPGSTPKTKPSSDRHTSTASPKPTERPKLAMDVKVHRMRFLKLHPKSILAMASTPLESSANRGSHLEGFLPPVRLAISREGGSVELISPKDRWFSVGNVPGVRGREVDALVWVCGGQGRESKGNRRSIAATLSSSSPGYQRSQNMHLIDESRHLFGCSRDGTIFELDFSTKRQSGVIGSGGGGVFCLASMCSHGNCCSSGSCGGYFAAGCEDGTIKIYTAFDTNGERTTSGMPELVATLPSAGNAVLSLAWLPGQSGRDDGGLGGSIIFAGVADGTIRRFDCTTSFAAGPISTGTILAPSRGSISTSYRWKSTLRMTVENRGLREATKVWALQALSDGTVVSGDSLGHVQMWDGLSGTMTQTFDHNESGADVLCLAVSEDENKIFASGVDSSVRCYQRSASTAEKSSQNMLEPTPLRKWVSSNSHRKHSHDVKALAICHKETGSDGKQLELLVSGSVDTRICSYVTKDYTRSRPKIWYNWPTLSPLSVSRKQRLLAVTRDDRIDLYQLSNAELLDPLKKMSPETKDETKCLIKTISIQSPFNLCCSAISDDGNYLAASDAMSLYLFSLKIEEEDGVFDILPAKLILSGECKHPATALRFDNQGRLICATTNGPITVLKVSPASEADSPVGPCKVSLEHVFKEHTIDWPASSHHFPIVCLDLSSDGKWLAAARFSSGKGAIHVFALTSKNEDGQYQHWWSIPKMDAPTTCIKFLGEGSVESSLAVGCSNNEVYIYNLGRRSLSHWSNDMGVPILKSLPRELTSRSEPIARIVTNPERPQRFILGSHGYFCVVDLDQPVPVRSSMFPSDHLRANRLILTKEDDKACQPLRKNPKGKMAGSANTQTNFTICLRYCEILFQDFVANDEMVIVEEPWMSILEELPDALARRAYGT